MALIKSPFKAEPQTGTTFWDAETETIAVYDNSGDFIAPTRIRLNGDVEIKISDEKSITVSDLLARLEALEEAYMEDKLLGVKNGTNKENEPSQS